jgi:hypothetical protein
MNDPPPKGDRTRLIPRAHFDGARRNPAAGADLCAPVLARRVQVRGFPTSFRVEIAVSFLSLANNSTEHLVRKLMPALVLLASFGISMNVAGQIAIEVTGDVGYTAVDAADWLRNGVYNPAPLSYAFSGQVVVGRRESRSGLQAGLEGGLHHLLAYDVTRDGAKLRGDAKALRLLGFTRFWMGENHSWFGEIAVGAHIFDGFIDPSLNVAVGTVLGSGKIQFPVKVRGSVLFDIEAVVIPVVFQTGISYRLGG